MKGGMERVMSRIVKTTMERLMDSKNRKLQNSGVSKQRSHNHFVTFSHIVLENIQFFSHSSGELGQAALESCKMQREQGQRPALVFRVVGGGGVGCQLVE